MRNTYLIIGTIAIIVVATVIYGFSAAGSPFETRSRKFDEERVRDIQSLKSVVESYYTKKGSLPKTLSELDDSRYYLNKDSKNDPETGKEYEYSIVSSTKYKICATFSIASDEQRDTYSYYNKEFKHPKGYHCFNLSISSTLISSQLRNNYKVTLVSPESRVKVDSPVTFTAKTTGSSDKKVKITFQKWDGSIWEELGETEFADTSTEKSIKVDVSVGSFYWRARACDEDSICGTWSGNRLLYINKTS